MRRSQLLDVLPAGAFDRVADLAARIFSVPIATVTIVDERWTWLKSHHSHDDDRVQIRRDPGLCAAAVLRPDPHLVTAATDPRTLNNPLVRDMLGLRFYAAAPITTTDGYPLGTVNVIDHQPRHPDRGELAVLASLAAMVADELELRLSAMRTVAAERRRYAQLEREKRLLGLVNNLEAKLARQLQRELERRVVIEQAKGVLMTTEDLTPLAALERLQTLARSQDCPEETIAAKLLAGNLVATPRPA